MTTSYHPTGLTRYHSAGAYRGYTLFSPNGGDEAFLIDMEGTFVHRWHYPGGINYGYLLDNGNLLFRDQGSNPPGADHIREIDWGQPAGLGALRPHATASRQAAQRQQPVPAAAGQDLRRAIRQGPRRLYPPQ